MKFFLALAVSLLLASCDSVKQIPTIDTGQNVLSDFTFEELWICHHPGTKFHNEYCVESEYPAGCYVSGDNSKFCWLFDTSICKESNIPDSLQKFCM